MEVKIVEEKENVFLKRKEVKIEIAHHGSSTPSKSEVEKIIAEKFKTTPDHIVVDYIFTKTGIGESVVKAKIYKEKVKKPEEKPKEEAKPVEEKPKEEAKPTEEETKKEEVEKTESGGGEKVETQTSQKMGDV